MTLWPMAGCTRTACYTEEYIIVNSVHSHCIIPQFVFVDFYFKKLIISQKKIDALYYRWLV